MTTLREARKTGNLERFIKEHENDPPGDMDRVDAAIQQAGRETGSKAPATSKPG